MTLAPLDSIVFAASSQRTPWHKYCVVLELPAVDSHKVPVAQLILGKQLTMQSGATPALFRNDREPAGRAESEQCQQRPPQTLNPTPQALDPETLNSSGQCVPPWPQTLCPKP